MFRQAPTANHGVGATTAVGCAKQAPDRGWKVTDVSERFTKYLSFGGET